MTSCSFFYGNFTDLFKFGRIHCEFKLSCAIARDWLRSMRENYYGECDRKSKAHSQDCVIHHRDTVIVTKKITASQTYPKVTWTSRKLHYGLFPFIACRFWGGPQLCVSAVLSVEDIQSRVVLAGNLRVVHVIPECKFAVVSTHVVHRANKVGVREITALALISFHV